MPKYETTAKHDANGTLSFYKDNVHYVHTLWVETLSQPHQINGSGHQSMHMNHWYPKSYAPGNISLTVRCKHQADYQHLANFIRLHHRLLLETPGLRFSSRKGTTGLRHLMFLRVPSERIECHGWVPTFTLNKKGVFDPAPQCTFDFFVAIDPFSSDPLISHQIREWWNPAKMKPTDPFLVDPEQGDPERDDTEDVTKETRRKGPD